jgi:peptidoglycan/xylan/chitin deacetylase (PgdA/CDA1 family)
MFTLGKSRIQKAETAAIFVVAALLLATLADLTVKSVNAGEQYPELYAMHTPQVMASAKKTVYFTFDDGPSLNTERILDVLKEEGIKATFFVCAQGADGVDEPAMMRRILDEGHELGLHSMTHDYNKVYSSLEGYLKDLNELNDYVLESTGFRPSIIRFPGGSSTVKASKALMNDIKAEMARRGYRHYDWTVESGDQTAKVHTPEYICDKVVKGAGESERVIVLMHDSPGPKTTPDALKLAIPLLREKGYAFDKLTAEVEWPK